ncbi:hypothetical protein V6N12_032977 [Hibiscus sabdariffa]
MGKNSSWDLWVEESLKTLESKNIYMPLKPMNLSVSGQQYEDKYEAPTKFQEDEYQTFDGIQPWDRLAVQISMPQSFIQQLLSAVDFTTKNERDELEKLSSKEQQFKKLTLFAGNDFLGLSRHPTIAKATAKAAMEQGTGPRGSPLICGYTNYHIALESILAKLKKKEACVVCSSGYVANMSLLSAIGSVTTLLSAGPAKEEKTAIFSDQFNHASIIDGLTIAQRLGGVELFVYQHNDMSHLDALLTNCKMKRKVVVTDSLFSMDGDFAPVVELARLRKKHGFLLVLDDAHGSFVWGKNGGGVAEEFNCENDVDICVGTLSKGASCVGGFIACSKTWKQLIQIMGRSYAFSTAAPVPLAAASYASVMVARKESWRRIEIRKRMQEFQALTGIPVTTQIACVIIGDPDKTRRASQELLESGFFVVPILGPPTVPLNTARLRVTLTAVHTTEDVKKLATIISKYVRLQIPSSDTSSLSARL